MEEENDSPAAAKHQEDEMFPVGLRVLAVDDNIVCLKLVEKCLLQCGYKVTTKTEADEALELLKEDKNSFDIVITDVHMSNKCDGFRFLEIIGLKMEIPVVMMSADDDNNMVLKAVKHGACDYLVKPVRVQEIKNIWQHVIRKQKQVESSNNDIKSQNYSKHATTKAVKRERENDKEDMANPGETTATKRKRFSWTPDKHAKFIDVVTKLGIDKAVPSRILEKMNMEGLTREKIASHLQKFRTGLKKGAEQQTEIRVASSGMNYGQLQNLTQLSFNRGSTGVAQFHGSHISGGSSNQIIQFGHHQVHQPETFGGSVINRQVPSHYLNQQSSLSHQYPHPLQVLQPHLNPRRPSVPMFGAIPSNSTRMERGEHSLMYHQSFPSTTTLPSSSAYIEHPSGFHGYNNSIGGHHPMSGFPPVLGYASNLQPSGDSFDLIDMLPSFPPTTTISMMTTHTDPPQVVENVPQLDDNVLAGQFDGDNSVNLDIPSFDDENFILSDSNLMEEHPIDHFETENMLQSSSSCSADDDLNAIVKQEM